MRMTQADGSKLESRQIVSTQFSMEDENQEFKVDAEVLNIGARQFIIGLSWLRENGFSINPVKRTLSRPGYTVKCVELKLSQIIMITAEENETYLEEGDYCMIVDVAAEYPEQMKAFSKEVADQLPPHRKWDHESRIHESRIHESRIHESRIHESRIHERDRKSVV